MTSFTGLQSEHQALLERLPTGKPSEQYLSAVQAFIVRATSEAANVPGARDREQLRANLRFWAAYVFDQTGAYPDTTLRPSTLPDTEAPSLVPPTPPRRFNWLLLAAGTGGLCVALALCLVLGWPLLSDNVFGAAPSNTPSLAPTADRTATQLAAAQLTKTAQPVITDLATPSVTPPITSSEEATEVPTELAPRRTVMLADVSHEQGPDCDVRAVQVSVDPAGLLLPEQLRGALAELRFSGSEEPDAVAEVGPNGASLSVEVFDGDQEGEALLLSVTHPELTFSSLVLQFEPGCTGNLAVVRYVATEAATALASETPPLPNLDLGWTLIAWGPAPEDAGAWIAQIELFARGGNGNYIFWDGAAHMSDEPEILLSQRACEAAHRAVGVSSGGVSVVREIILQTPYCPSKP